jgi:hypothetical protein
MARLGIQEARTMLGIQSVGVEAPSTAAAVMLGENDAAIDPDQMPTRALARLFMHTMRDSACTPKVSNGWDSGLSFPRDLILGELQGCGGVRFMIKSLCTEAKVFDMIYHVARFGPIRGAPDGSAVAHAIMALMRGRVLRRK